MKRRIFYFVILILSNISTFSQSRTKQWFITDGPKTQDADMYDVALCNSFMGSVDDNFIGSNWQSSIFIAKGVPSLELPDTVDKLKIADIDFIPSKNIVLVPSLFAKQR
jgi:hypothetical protein